MAHTATIGTGCAGYTINLTMGAPHNNCVLTSSWCTTNCKVPKPGKPCAQQRGRGDQSKAFRKLATPPPPKPRPPRPAARPITCPGHPVPFVVSKVSNVTIENLKIGGPWFTDKLTVRGGSGIKYLKLDNIYTINSQMNTQMWNDTGLHIRGLTKHEVVHAIHLDTNLNVTSSTDGTVLVGMLIQSTLTVANPGTKTGQPGGEGDNGRAGPVLQDRTEGGSATVDSAAASGAPAPASVQVPPLGFLTFIGLLADYDVWIEDDESVVVADLYAEQLALGHLKLSGTGEGDTPGRISIQGVKSHIENEGAWATIDNYYGSLFYMGSFFLVKSFPEWHVTQVSRNSRN